MDFLRNRGQSVDNRDFTVCIIRIWTPWTTMELTQNSQVFSIQKVAHPRLTNLQLAAETCEDVAGRNTIGGEEITS